MVSFIGLVRDMNDSEQVAAMELEHYPGMTEKSLQDCSANGTALASNRQPDYSSVGPLQPCDQIVLVAAASVHRGEALPPVNL